MKKQFVIRDGVTNEYFGGYYEEERYYEKGNIYWSVHLPVAKTFDSLESIEEWIKEWAFALSDKFLIIETIFA